MLVVHQIRPTEGPAEGSQGKATVIQSSIEPSSGLEDLSGCFPKGLVTNFGWCCNFEFEMGM